MKTKQCPECKENQLYEYKGRQICERKAINYVIENSLGELKKYLKGE